MSHQFVCVRIQSMNGINLDLFQFEFDLTWMSFFMDAENHVYTRYGGRDDRDPESHLNRDSLLGTMRKALMLHKLGDVLKSSLEPTGRTVRTPEQIPTMRAMMAKRKNKCIHCHDIKVATLKHLRNRDKLKRQMVFTYPTPANLGISVDPVDQSVVDSVRPGTPAARAGIRAGDQIASAGDHRVLTLGDFSRVLERTPARGRLSVQLKRNGQSIQVPIELPNGWRQSTDPSWRESLHAVGPNCGLWGRRLNAKERRRLKFPPNKLALKVTFIWGPHTRKAGIRVGDVVVGLDGQSHDMTIKQFNAHPMLRRNWGDTVPVILRRGNRDVTVQMTFPNQPPPD